MLQCFALVTQNCHIQTYFNLTLLPDIDIFYLGGFILFQLNRIGCFARWEFIFKFQLIFVNIQGNLPPKGQFPEPFRLKTVLIRANYT